MTSNSGSSSFPFSFSSFSSSWRAQEASSSSYPSSYASSTSSDSSSSLVGPEPPVVLPPETHADGRPSSPHQCFLISGPAFDSPVEVETLPGEYRVQVRLPGFKRELITLSTKRRRVLHLVANRWENGGGHFERRIAFGYDADLVQVKAEFDGELLRVKIPRRIAYVPQNQIRNAPVGRTS